MTSRITLEDAERIIGKYEQREATARKERENADKISRARHLQAVMEYDDARTNKRPLGWRFRTLKCRLGIHRSRWDPRYISGTSGFCTRCGASTGTGWDHGGY